MNQPENMLSYFDVKYKYRPTYGLNSDIYPLTPGTFRSPENEAKECSQIDPLDQLMGEKRELLHSKIEMILVGIEERKKIKQ